MFWGNPKHKHRLDGEWIKSSPEEKGRRRHVGLCSEKGHRNDQRAGTPLLWGKAERVGLFSPKKRRLWGQLTAAFQYLKGETYKSGGEGLFTRVCSNRTRGNGSKLREGRFRQDIRKQCFTMRLMRHGNRLPRAVVDAPSLEALKAKLDEALGNLV